MKAGSLTLALLAVAILTGPAAYALWFVSGAHGHGLASTDRAAIFGLSSASALSLVGAYVSWVRSRGRP